MGLLDALFGGGGNEPPPDPRQPHTPSLAEFFNPLSQPPGAPGPTPGPSLGDVLIPPAGNSPVQPPGMLEFLNPFSPPPGQRQAQETPAIDPQQMLQRLKEYQERSQQPAQPTYGGSAAPGALWGKGR